MAMDFNRFCPRRCRNRPTHSQPATDSVAKGLAENESDRHHGGVGRTPSNASEVRLDDVSKAIIEQLQEDGRQSYATIAKRVGLSEAAVRQRVQRLLEQEVMQIVAVTDPLQVGFRRQAMIGLRVDGDLTPVGDALTAMPEVSYVVTTAGSFDLLCEVVCEDDDQLLELLTRRVRTLPGVQSTETFVYLKLNKQHYNWGTR
jgi:Lrp/AsnC family transcriptional regulator for asnA, asnC and gidA